MKRIRYIGPLMGMVIIWARTAWGAQGPPQITPDYQDTFSKVLEFLYTAAHWIGEVITNVVQSIVPAVVIPSSLVDAIGLLGLLTGFLAIAEIAKRLVWIVVIVGWALIVIRIVMVVVQGSS